MQSIPIFGDHRPSKSIDQTRERILNWYIHIDNSDVKNPKKVLYPRDGLGFFSSPGGTEVRNGFGFNSTIYVVAGATLYEINSLGVATSKGVLNSISGPIKFASIDDYMMIVDGVNGYVYQASTDTFTQILDSDFPNGATSVTAQDGYFIVPVPGTQQYQICNNSDPLTWDSLKVGTVGAEGDLLVAAYSFIRDLWMFGERSIELHYDEGSSVQTPFLLRDGGVLEYGLAAANSLSAFSDSLPFLARTPTGKLSPVILQGGQITPIFNSDIISEINTFETFSDAVGYVIPKDDHEFYVLNFPAANKTYAWDNKTGYSHELTSYVDGDIGRFRGSCYFSAHGKRLIGDSFTGTIYELSADTYTEDGNPIYRTLRTPIWSDNDNYLSLYKFKVFFETNMALTEGQGSDPQVIGKFSNNGGHTFGPEIFKSLGTSGQFNDIVQWNNLGMGRKWVFEMTVSDPINWIVLGAASLASLSDDL